MPSHDRDLAREIQNLRVQLVIVTLAFFLMLGIQLVQLISDRVALINLRTTQEPNVQQSLKVRQQLDAVASGIARLADSGDPSARAIVEDLRRQGITVRNPQGGTTQ